MKHTEQCWWHAFACAAENMRDEEIDRGSIYLGEGRPGPTVLARWADGYLADGTVSCLCPDHTEEYTFAEDEGGTTVIRINSEHLTIDRHSGPDCDMTTTESHLVYLPCDTAEEERDERTGPMRWDVLECYRVNPHSAWFDEVISELGGALLCQYLLSQPEMSG